MKHLYPLYEALFLWQFSGQSSATVISRASAMILRILRHLFFPVIVLYILVRCRCSALATAAQLMPLRAANDLILRGKRMFFCSVFILSPYAALFLWPFSGQRSSTVMPSASAITCRTLLPRRIPCMTYETYIFDTFALSAISVLCIPLSIMSALTLRKSLLYFCCVMFILLIMRRILFQ